MGLYAVKAYGDAWVKCLDCGARFDDDVCKPECPKCKSREIVPVMRRYL